MMTCSVLSKGINYSRQPRTAVPIINQASLQKPTSKTRTSSKKSTQEGWNCFDVAIAIFEVRKKLLFLNLFENINNVT